MRMLPGYNHDTKPEAVTWPPNSPNHNHFSAGCTKRSQLLKTPHQNPQDPKDHNPGGGCGVSWLWEDWCSRRLYLVYNTCISLVRLRLISFTRIHTDRFLRVGCTTSIPVCLTVSHIEAGLPVWLPCSSSPRYPSSVSPFLPLPHLIWFSLSLNLRWGSSVSHSAHCVGSMCRSSPSRSDPYQPRQTTRPLIKAALLSILIQQQLEPIGIRLIVCHPTQ